MENVLEGVSQIYINILFYLAVILILVIFNKIIFINPDKFRDLGIALHLNNKLNVIDKYKKIKNNPDFIHLDYISNEIAPNNESINTELISTIKNTWPNKNIQIHIMAKNYQDVINEIGDEGLDYFIHEEFLKENLDVFSENIGVVITTKTNKSRIEEIMSKFNKIMVLCIDKPGYSGQKFNEDIAKSINIISNLSSHHEIILDGGINPEIARKFNVDSLVSASSLESSKYPFFHVLKYQLKKQ